MRAGPMRCRGILQSRGEDTLAGVQWTDVVSIWFALEPFRGDQRVIAGSIQNPMQHTIKMRYRAGVTAAMRIKMGTRIFDFIAISDTENKHKDLKIDVLEGASNG